VVEFGLSVRIHYYTIINPANMKLWFPSSTVSLTHPLKQRLITITHARIAQM
jgi:hypothetical protein